VLVLLSWFLQLKLKCFWLIIIKINFSAATFSKSERNISSYLLCREEEEICTKKCVMLHRKGLCWMPEVNLFITYNMKKMCSEYLLLLCQNNYSLRLLLLVFLNLYLWNTRFMFPLTSNFCEWLTNTHYPQMSISKYRLAEFLLVHHMTSMHILSQYLKFVTDTRTSKDAYHQWICNLQLVKVYCTKCVHILKTITTPNFTFLAETVNYFSVVGFLQQLLLKTSVFQDGSLCQVVNFLL